MASALDMIANGFGFADQAQRHIKEDRITSSIEQALAGGEGSDVALAELASLAPNSANAVAGTLGQRQAAQQQQQVGAGIDQALSAEVPAEAEAALARLAKLGDQDALAFAQNMLQSRNEAELTEARVHIDRVAREAALLSSIDDYDQQTQVIAQLAQQAQAEGRDTSEYAELISKDIDGRKADLLGDTLRATDAASVNDIALSNLRPEPGEGFTLSKDQIRFDANNQEVARGVSSEAEVEPVNEAPPKGYRWNNPDDPNSGLAPIPGGPAAELTAESQFLLI